MPGSKKYRPQQNDEAALEQIGALPTDRPVAVYYRQSSMAQVGNISTDMQQIDLPKYIMTLGWDKDAIILIDEDEGVSGAKRIDERAGMRRLYDLIITGQIGAVAVQAEDRLFRDETQIQVNVFIDACLKNNVRVVTPYFKYNFSNKNEGPYHRLLFRNRAEQAADFLNSYVRGRLYAAKERMMLLGMWMGGNINLGYMVDKRKYLSSGIPNPDYHKFQPFEPCAEVVVRIFETFVLLGGNQQATLRHLYENGPHFPDFDDPELLHQVPPGFYLAKPMRMRKRGRIYTVGSIALQTMLTNAVYLGHWVFKDRIVQWNNHPAIVPEDLFFKAFNYMSPHNFDGTPNLNYAPRLERIYSTKKQDHAVPEPVYLGLVGSDHEGKWRNATASWRKNVQTYVYTCGYTNLVDNSRHLWSRRSDYFDEILDEMLHAKLRASFDSKVWKTTLKDTETNFGRERQKLRGQLASVEQKLQNLLHNFTFVQSQTLLQALQKEFETYELERDRIKLKLDELSKRIDRQDALTELAKQADSVLKNWKKLAVTTKQAVAQLFIEKIVIDQRGKHRVADVKIHWVDRSTDEFIFPYRARAWELWAPQEVETLRRLITEQASQVEIAAALPKRNWRAIRIKIYEIIGTRSFHIFPKPIREGEKYADFAQRTKTNETPLRLNGPHWRPKEIEELGSLLDSGASQLELCAALPHRSWAKIRKKITQLQGADFKVARPPVPVKKHETYNQYLERNPAGAATMNCAIGGYWSPRRSRRRPSQQQPASGRARPPSPPGSK
jgi:hypothetical protein